jgi:glycine dehydrogenase subunit 1
MVFKATNKMKFVPNAEKEKKEMMIAIGVNEIAGLFKDIPEKILLKKRLNLPKSMTEMELRQFMESLSKKNKKYISFLGAGSYNHFIPSVVNHVISRSEFYTAYTPYQPEISQGILQAIYEYQSMMCSLTGMDVANASMYDGASALAESALMASRINGKEEIVVSRTVHPEYREVLRTYASANSMRVVEVDFDDGVTSIEGLKDKAGSDTAAVLVQSPNFFGCIENLAEIGNIAHEKGSLFVVCVNEATSLGLLKIPAADIVCGEAQSFGNPLCFGGPYLGFIAAKQEFMRQIPGRLVGATLDSNGERAYVLTLQAREQHIRREKATSNICSNEALCALAATVYLVALGKNLRQLAEVNVQKAGYALSKLKEAGFKQVFNQPFYNEFVVKCDDVKKVNELLLKKKIVGGLELEKYYPDLKNCLLFCVTEMISKKEIDRMVRVFKKINGDIISAFS